MLYETRIAAQMSRCQRIYDNMDPPDYDDRYIPLDNETTLDADEKIIIENYVDEDGLSQFKRQIILSDFRNFPELMEWVPEVFEELTDVDGSSEDN